MRLKIDIKPIGNNIKCDYKYSMSACIYNILREGSPEFSDFLHEKGYGNDKPFKFFTFSDIYIPNVKIDKGKLVTSSDSENWHFHLSSPLPNFKNVFIEGLFKSNRIKISDQIFSIQNLKDINFPNINKNKYLCKTLSPVISSTMNDNKETIFLGPFNAMDEKLRSNILRKINTLEIADIKNDFKIKPSNRTIFNRKKYRINQNDVIAYHIDNFIIEGNKKLIKFVWESGLGEKNSQGFGMFKIRKIYD